MQAHDNQCHGLFFFRVFNHYYPLFRSVALRKFDENNESMTTIIQLDQEELKAAIKDVVTDVLKDFQTAPEQPLPDRITDLDEVAEITGYGIGKIYKLTSTGKIPCERYGPRRLVFSRRKLTEWMLERTRPIGDDGIEAITKVARRRVYASRA